MKLNLNFDHYLNGDPIPEVQDSAQWVNLTTGAWCYYNNDSANGAIYGKLYNWFAVTDPRGLAPKGWYIPNYDECMALTTYLGGEKVCGGKLKEKGTDHWLSPNTGATNESGFTALPGGFRSYEGEFDALGYLGNWWTITAYNDSLAWFRELDNEYIYCFCNYKHKNYALSVRCLKD